MAPALLAVDYYVPLANRKLTIAASSITLLVLAWLAVSLRLYTRYKIRSFGWDDALVACAGLSSIAGTIFLQNEIPYGLGLHLRTMLIPNKEGMGFSYKTFEGYLLWFYLTNISYAASTTLIKLSILVQYLRLFPRAQHKTVNNICIVLITIVASWGVGYFLVAIFGCNPIHKAWKPLLPGKCIMFGSTDIHWVYVAYTSQTASNMCVDILILLVPLPSLVKATLCPKQKLCLFGLFSIGTVAVICSALRLWLVIKSRAGTYPTQDPPWYAPPIILMSCLEIDLAIVTASVPIFWPLITNFGAVKINVVQEVIVNNETRKTWFLERTIERDGATSSTRRSSDGSEVNLKLADSTADHHRQYYADRAIADMVVGGIDREDGEGRSAAAGHSAQAWYDPVALQTFHKK
ncbi:uncharacterized protein K452DRAFT_307739 [Aplosporella prunicola CBS 121167]|uniref:Rhodopsin domain-containing protein n=1 Tax=Aplosporella prunicola CBS 121167 TaxID=1176127 RepID=A0A6A6BHA2_9PEZI|nr:uncharacterized protein K452DRAFT_307739 [Aplosporella prunicola CBS 121167]KAF2142823.1 hypothetical protein K452DRAFT_307739 [Aplosporella prunicola CBS 121167]